MKMDSVVMIKRGWPNEGALDRAEPITAGATVTLGDWVQKQADGTVNLTGASATNLAGLVVQGNGDSASAQNSGRAVVLWSGFIADVSNYDTVPTYVPGSSLTVKSGKLTLGTVGTDPIIGTVLDVVAVGPNDTAHLTVLVK